MKGGSQFGAWTWDISCWGGWRHDPAYGCRRSTLVQPVLRAETSLDVCRHFSVRRHTASAPQSTTTRWRIGRSVQGGRRDDRGINSGYGKRKNHRLLPPRWSSLRAG